MKTTVVLALSLLANAILALAVLRPATPGSNPGTVGFPPAATSSQAGGAATPDRAVQVPVDHLWTRLHSGNLDEFARRLRAAGFPPRETRLLLAEAINEDITSRREALIGKAEDIPYWRRPQVGVRDTATQQQLWDLNKELRELTYQYVNGPDSLADDEAALITAKRRFGNLPLELLQKLTAMQFDAETRRMEIGERAGKAANAEQSRAIWKDMETVDKELLAEAAKFLTPEQLQQYELRTLDLGLRSNLANFRPTEEEFKALHAARKQWTEAMSPPEIKALTLAVLSPERQADYQVLMTSDGTGNLGKLISRLELPLTTITTVNGVRDDINRRAKAIGADRSLSADQRQAQLGALAQEAREKLTGTLGVTGYEAYSDLKGDWIRALKPGGP